MEENELYNALHTTRRLAGGQDKHEANAPDCVTHASTRQQPHNGRGWLWTARVVSRERCERSEENAGLPHMTHGE